MSFFGKSAWNLLARRSNLPFSLLYSLPCLLCILYLLPSVDSHFDPRNYQRFLSYYCILLGFLIWLLDKNPNSKDAILSTRIYTTLSWFVLLTIAIHFIQLTYAFRESFFLGERDFTSMAEVILNTSKGLWFQSAFHGEESNSYLAHHFAPLLILFVPFSYLSETRIFLAWGQLFYYLVLIYIIWRILAKFYFVSEIKYNKNAELRFKLAEQDEYLPETRKNLTKYYLEKFLLFSFFLTNIYLYRMLTSYHFEILYVIFFLLLIHSMESKKSLFLSILWTICTSFVKEDASIYLILYFLGNIIWILGNNLYSKFFSQVDSQKNRISNDREDISAFKDTQNIEIASYNGVESENEITSVSLKSKNQYSILVKNLVLFALSFILLIAVIPLFRKILHVEAEENWWAIWSTWGDGTLSIVFGLIQNLPQATNQILSKWKTILEIGLSTGLLILCARKYWFYTLCLMGIHFLSSRLWHNTFYNYYIYALLPVLIYGTLIGWKNLRSRISLRLRVPLLLLLLALSFYRNSWDKNFPFALPRIDKVRIEIAEKLAAKIPEDSRVAVQFDLGIFLSNRNQILPLERISVGSSSNHKFNPTTSLNIDYIWIDTIRGFSPYVSLSQIDSWKEFWLRSDYEIYVEEQGMQILKKRD